MLILSIKIGVSIRTFAKNISKIRY